MPADEREGGRVGTSRRQQRVPEQRPQGASAVLLALVVQDVGEVGGGQRAAPAMAT